MPNTKHVIYIIVGFLSLHNVLFGQRVDYNAIILPNNAKDISIEERLVQLAWSNNPENQILNNQVNIAGINTKLARLNLFNQINATGNINEFTINPPSTDFPIFFPRYNFSATLSLGNIFSDPLKVKRAKQEKEIALNTINKQKITIRAEVLRRYQVYLTSKQILVAQTAIVERSRETYVQAKTTFEAGRITLQEHDRILEVLDNQQSKLILITSDVRIAEIDVEEMIGVKLIDVIDN